MSISGRRGELYKEETQGEQKDNLFLSNTFRLWVVAFIFFLTCLHLYAIIAYPQIDILPTEIILSVALVLAGYIWIQEFRDRHRLQLLNKALIEAQEQLERDEIDTIATLILSLEAKDAYTRGHSKRVARSSVAIAREMGFSEERKRIIERAGILHDLGKLGVMDNILKKVGKLSDEELKVVKKHPQRSVEILKPLRFLSREKGIIPHHHERYDGGGYLDGLKAEEIPLEARILAVADAFDAMNSERSYRKPLPKDVIISELKKASGSQLDSSVVTVFLNLLEKNPRLWERD